MIPNLTLRLRVALFAAAALAGFVFGVRDTRADEALYRMWEDPIAGLYCGGPCAGFCCRIIPTQPAPTAGSQTTALAVPRR
jgi:hypothetical protein